MSNGTGFEWDDHLEREVDRWNESNECVCGAEEEESCTCNDEPDDGSDYADEEMDRQREEDW